MFNDYQAAYTDSSEIVISGLETTKTLFDSVYARYKQKCPKAAALVFDINSEEATKKLFDIISLDRNADAIALHRHLNHYIRSNKVLTMPYKELVQHKKHCAYAVGLGGAIVTAAVAVGMSRLPTILEFSKHNIDLQDLAALQKIATDADTAFDTAFNNWKKADTGDKQPVKADDDATAVEAPVVKKFKAANAASSTADKEVGKMQGEIDSHIPSTPDSSEIAFATITCLALAALTAYGIHHFASSKVSNNDLALMNNGGLTEKLLSSLSHNMSKEAVKHKDDILTTHKAQYQNTGNGGFRDA
jgi:hypothetical protein